MEKKFYYDYVYFQLKLMIRTIHCIFLDVDGYDCG